MKLCLRLLVALVALLGLAACDYFAQQELKPGLSTGAEVRERLGAPSEEWANIDGTSTWEHSRQAEGSETYMVVIGPDNILREIRQVLTEENFARVEKGMSQDNIRRLLGRPASKTPFVLKHEVVWEWRYNAGPGTIKRFQVYFGEDGKVSGSSHSDEHSPA